jgi:glyoxylase-like metal-dependent hydrolase (beta-lactamase superfamily II)
VQGVVVTDTQSRQTDPIFIWQLKYGERVVKKSDVFHDYESYGLPDGELEMDYSFWLLRSGSTVILFDTGYDIPAHDWLGEISVTPPLRGLELVGVAPADVDLVITSHFHYDHIGFLSQFTSARVVAAQAEYDNWIPKLRAGALEGEFATEENLRAVVTAEEEGRLQLVSEPTEVFPGITVYPIGGHCPGELLASVDSAAGPVIMASDAAHFYDQLEHEWPFFAYSDIDEMRRGLRFINELAASKGAQIVPGHDARVRERYPSAPGAAGAVANVIA